jgi:hypothetical protein
MNSGQRHVLGFSARRNASDSGLRVRDHIRLSACQARIDLPVDKRRASHPLPQAAFKLASFLRQPRLAQAFEHMRQIRRMRDHPFDGEFGKDTSGFR